MRDETTRPVSVEAKFLQPRLDHVNLRPGTRRAFEIAFSRRLTIVLAPAGYGKTTSTAASLRQCGHSSSWYKLDVLDHDPIVFLAAMVRAVRRHSPDFGEALLHDLETLPAAELSTDLLAARFVSECDRAIDDDHYIVLDDYHEASDSPAMNRVLAYILANCRGSMHFLVLTRYEPAFPFEKLRLEGEVSRIGGDLLRFDLGQVAEVLHTRSNQTHDPAHVARLFALTEGWPVSVVLAGMALVWLDESSLESALADPRLKIDMYSYLAEQVLARQARDVRRFLLRTCCLDHITVDLAERLVGSGDAHRQLRHLSGNRIFTFDADRQGAFRYHNLFRDFLCQRVVQEEGQQAFRELQCQTATALEASGDTQRAVELLLKANEPSPALDVIARAGEAGLERCPSDQLRLWLERIQPAVGPDRPWIHVLAGALGAREGRFASALAELRGAIAMMEQLGDEDGLYQALSITEWVEFWSGDSAATMKTCSLAYERAGTDAQRLHTLLSLMSAALDMRQWDVVEEASAWTQDLLPRAQPEEQSRAQALKAYAAFYRGDARDAQALIRLCYRPEQTTALRASALNTQGMVDMTLGQYESASRCLQEAAETARSFGHALTSYMIADNIAFLRASIGEVEPALEMLAALRGSEDPVQEPTLLCFTLSHESTVLRRSGRVKDSLEPGGMAAEQVSHERDPYLALNAAANLAFAEGLLGESRTTELHALSNRAVKAGLQFVSLKALLYAGVLRFLDDDRSAAAELLERCLPDQLRLGHINLIAQELCPRGDLAALVLRRHRSNGLGPSLLAALGEHWQFEETSRQLRRDCPSEIGTWLRQLEEQRLTALDVPPGVATRQDEDPSATIAEEALPELTRRERQVLALMAQDRTNAEIARDLFLALPTVKTHVNHVLRKLRQTSRLGAVLEYQRRASRLGGHETAWEEKAWSQTSSERASRPQAPPPS